jgi:hypothetical protein
MFKIKEKKWKGKIMYFDYYSLLCYHVFYQLRRESKISYQLLKGMEHLTYFWVECKWNPAFHSTRFFSLRFTPLWRIPSILSFPLHWYDPCKLADKDIHDKLLHTLNPE